MQEALHYEETILAEEEEVESKPEDRGQNKMSLAPKSWMFKFSA